MAAVLLAWWKLTVLSGKSAPLPWVPRHGAAGFVCSNALLVKVCAPTLWLHLVAVYIILALCVCSG